MTDKQVIRELVDGLPEEVSLDQIVEEVNILMAIRRGRADAVAGKTKTPQETKALVQSWATTWGGCPPLRGES